ncbi:MAG: glycosyltransferase family 39 protein [Ramlibacter sp.]
MTAAVSIPASLSAPRDDGLLSLPAALLAACLTVAAWVVLAACMNHSQLHDSLEQFVWGQSLEWGYWKHPPLTSWLMWGALKVLGPTPFATYVLGAVLTMATIACTVRLAQLLAGREVAVLTALLLVLHYGLTRRAQVYNHNTVLLACSAAMALAVLHAVRADRRRDWLLAGLAAGLAMLAKYQAVVPIAGALLAIVLAGDARRRLPGVLLATAVALALFLPHVVWTMQRGFETVHYATSYMNGQGAHGGGRSLGVLAMQLKYFLPAIGFALLLWAAAGRGRPAAAAAPWPAEQRAWVAGLVLLPVLVLAGAVAAGVRVQSHWGLQATQFLLVPAAMLLHRRFGPWGRRHAWVWLAVQALALGIYVAQGAGGLHEPRHARDVRNVDAADISRQVLAQWQASTRCELRYLSGPVALAGMVSAYSHRTLRVLEDGDSRKSPWIDRDDMRARGFIALREQASGEPAPGEVVLPLAGAAPQASPRFLVLELHLPAQPC